MAGFLAGCLSPNKVVANGAGRLAPLIEVGTFPRSLMDAFFHAGATEGAWENLLKFLSPLTTRRGLLIAGSK